MLGTVVCIVIIYLMLLLKCGGVIKTMLNNTDTALS